MFGLDPPSGFRGFDPRSELSVYYRHLPHWRQSGATYFVTFRLGDSLPKSKLRELQQVREDWRREYFPERDPATDEASLLSQRRIWDDLNRKLTAMAENFLDQGIGSCVLERPAIREIMVDALMEFDCRQYELGAWVVMPNHVHLIVRPFDEDHVLEGILQNRKKWSARQINVVTGRAGPLWQQESYDRIIRDRQHLWKALQYIGNNPRKAGIGDAQSTRWVKPEWIRQGWNFLE